MNNSIDDPFKFPIVYKYRHWDDNFHPNIIKQNEIFFAHPDSLNDPDDINIPLRYDLLTEDQMFKWVEQTVRKTHSKWNDDAIKHEATLLSSQKHLSDQEFLKKYSEQSLKNFRDVIGVFCISIERDSMPMWAHYSKGHTGFCIGFNTKKLHEDIGGTIGGPTYVKEYAPLIPKENWSEGYISQTFTKHISWQYEQEIRILKTFFGNQAADSRKTKVRSETIEELYLGYKISEEHKKEILKVIQERNDLSHVKVYQMKKSIGPGLEAILIKDQQIT